MRAVIATKGTCMPPDFACIQVTEAQTPQPKSGQALVKVAASTVSPYEYKGLEGGSGSHQGILGHDVSGTVVECPGCKKLKSGDLVWGSVQHAYADYVAAAESSLFPMPESLNTTEAATIPGVGLTDVVCLQLAGEKRWSRKNLTVIVTSGAGGTGFEAIQLAKAYGASRVISTSSPNHFDFLKSVGADVVVDYHKQNIWDVLEDDSVDIVYDNYGKAGSGDKYMPKIRPGGAYIFLPNGDGNCFQSKSQKYPCVASKAKEGVLNVNVDTGKELRSSDVPAIYEQLRELHNAGQLKPYVQEVHSLEDTQKAYATLAEGHVAGKLAIVIGEDAQVSARVPNWSV